MDEIKQKYLGEMGFHFQKAYEYSINGYYKDAIPLYEKAVSEDRNSFAALNNLGLSQLEVAIQERDINLLEKAIQNFRKAITLTIDVYNFEDSFPGAQANLERAESEIRKLKSA